MVFHDVLSDLLKINKLSPERGVLDGLATYYELTQKWSKKINVTANIDPESYVLENLIDPILALESLKSFMIFDGSTRFTIADFGCGGGFVGLTWLLLLADRAQLILVDSDRKKINFCREVCRRINVQHVEIINNRCENLVETHANKLDFIVSRATFSDESSVQKSAAQLLVSEGKLLLLKGSSLAETIANTTPDSPQSGVTKLARYTILPSGAQRFVKIIGKNDAVL